MVESLQRDGAFEKLEAKLAKYRTACKYVLDAIDEWGLDQIDKDAIGGGIKAVQIALDFDREYPAEEKKEEEPNASLKRWTYDIMERREYDSCWHSDNEEGGDCGNWLTCNPHCSLREMMDHVGIVPQEDGGLDKQKQGVLVDSAPQEKQKESDPIRAVYERFKHLDGLFCDEVDSNDRFRQSLHVIWLAVKEAVEVKGKRDEH